MQARQGMNHANEVDMKLLLSTLNQAKSAFLLVTMTAACFEKYEYVPPPTVARKSEQAPMICRVQLKVRAFLASLMLGVIVYLPFSEP